MRCNCILIEIMIRKNIFTTAALLASFNAMSTHAAHHSAHITSCSTQHTFQHTAHPTAHITPFSTQHLQPFAAFSTQHAIEHTARITAHSTLQHTGRPTAHSTSYSKQHSLQHTARPTAHSWPRLVGLLQYSDTYAGLYLENAIICNHRQLYRIHFAQSVTLHFSEHLVPKAL